MTNHDEIGRLKEDLAASSELRETFDATLKRIGEAGEAKNDGEALVAVMRELGYDVSLADIERLYAEAQEVSDEELEAVAGYLYTAKWCLIDYYCYTAFEQGQEYETFFDQSEIACWSNHNCIIFNN